MENTKENTKPKEVIELFFDGFFRQNSINKCLTEEEYCKIVEEATSIYDKKYNSLVKKTTNRKVYFISDIHGCCESLEQAFKFYNKDSLFVIIGDLCDRGRNCAEILAVVLSMIITHGNIIYLRGNHETQGFQLIANTTVSRRIFEVYGDYKNWDPFCGFEKIKLLDQIYEFFGKLPYTALVNGVFCLHGGFVPEFEKIDDYGKLERKREINDVKNEQIVLWSDPLPKWTKNFKYNSKRKRGLFFGKGATRDFLEHNPQVKLVLRGHSRHFYLSIIEFDEINGYYFCHDDKILTIESCFNIEKKLENQTKGCVVEYYENNINIYLFFKKRYSEYNFEGKIDVEYVQGGDNEEWFMVCGKTINLL